MSSSVNKQPGIIGHGAVRDLLVALGLAIFCLSQIPAYSLPLMDDVYITLQHSRNIASGYGFTYNPGEHVLATTTPLYALLLAPIFFFSEETSTLMLVLLWLLTNTATAFLSYRLANQRIVGLICGLFIASLSGA